MVNAWHFMLENIYVRLIRVNKGSIKLYTPIVYLFINIPLVKAWSTRGI